MLRVSYTQRGQAHVIKKNDSGIVTKCHTSSFSKPDTCVFISLSKMRIKVMRPPLIPDHNRKMCVPYVFHNTHYCVRAAPKHHHHHTVGKSLSTRHSALIFAGTCFRCALIPVHRSSKLSVDDREKVKSLNWWPPRSLRLTFSSGVGLRGEEGPGD